MNWDLNNFINCPQLFLGNIFDELNEIANSESLDFPQFIQFKIAIAYTIIFVQKNCTGICYMPNDLILKFLDTYANFYMTSNQINMKKIPSDMKSELMCNIEYILVAKHIISNIDTINDNQTILKHWWLMRIIYVNQLILMENCPEMFENFEFAASYLLSALVQKPNFLKLANLEIFQMYLLYNRIISAKERLDHVKQLQNVRLLLTGKLGKRTRFQNKDVAQLLLKVQINDDTNDNNCCNEIDNDPNLIDDMPPVIPLNDEVRLNSVEYQEIESTELSNMEQLIVLAQCKYLIRSKPVTQDNLTREEIECYLDTILSQKFSCWSIRMNSILLQCRIDKFNKRTIERSLKHYETILDLMSGHSIKKGYYRWRYFWACGHRLEIDVVFDLAKRYKELSMMNSAADLYIRLQNWTELVDCYCIMNRNQEAISLIEKLLETDPKMIRLWVLYGDLKQNPEFYEKAWNISEQKSSLAQKRWGYYFYNNKDYVNCIDHFEKSLQINYLQNDVILRLGFAAICICNYQLAVRYYKLYTSLEPDCFEAWNNLAKAYYHLKDYSRASVASAESLKYDFENWKLWDNFMLFSFKAEQYEDTIRAFHRLLEFKAIDKESSYSILSTLCQISKEESCSEELRKKIAELMARATISYPANPHFWELYAFLANDEETKLQRLLKRYRALNQIGNLYAFEDFLNVAYEVADLLSKHSIRDKSLLHSSKLMLRSALAVIKTKTEHLQNIPNDVQDKLLLIQTIYDKVN